MTFINQDPEEEELTTKRGCFNCSRFKNCPFIGTERDNGRDFREVLEDQAEPYVFGCCCDNYHKGETKEKVQFT